MAGTELNKDMVDLAMKIKKHLRCQYEISIALADPELLDKMVELKNVDDPVLQGMLSYLMALAGPAWMEKFNARDATPAPAEPSLEKKKLFGRYRGKPFSNRDQVGKHKSAAEKHDEIRYRGSHPGDEEQAPPKKERRAVRYYRGQAIYEDD